MKPGMIRQHGFDNLRFILIFCVVLGHLLERSGRQETLYLIIYTFHMPVFLFLSGYFGKFRPRKLCRIAALYLLFQFLYQCFGDLSAGKSITVQFRRPDWIMWYLPVLLYCHLLIPLLDRFPRFPAVAVSIILALLSGFCDSIGYDFSLSRFFVFCPYFILGNRVQKHSASIESAASRVPGLAIPVLLLVNLLFCLLLFSAGRVNAIILYGTHPYRIGYGPLTRLLLYLLGFLWTAWFLILSQTRLNRRIPLLSALGQNTLPIYLLHGFAVKLIWKHFPIPEGFFGVLSALALSILLVSVLGSHWIGTALTLRMDRPTAGRARIFLPFSIDSTRKYRYNGKKRIGRSQSYGKQ